MDGYGRAHTRPSRAGCLDGEYAADMTDTFAHAGKSDAQSRRLGIKSPSCIFDLQHDAIGLYLEAHRGPRAGGMTVNIGERLLRDTKQAQFIVGRQPMHRGRKIEPHLDGAALMKAVSQPAQGAEQSQFIEQRRMQQIGRSSDFRRALGRQPDAVFEQLAPPIGGAPCVLQQLGQAQFQRSEGLPGGVVQITADSAPFFILQAHQFCGQHVQIMLSALANRHVVHDREREHGSADTEA